MREDDEMHPIPAFIMDRIFPSLMHGGGLHDYVWNELEYSCNPVILKSVQKLVEAVHEVDYSNLPELQGTEKQISFAQTIREKALRAEAALQQVLVGSKIVRFSLSPSVKAIDQSRFWIENKDELTRQLKAVHIKSQTPFDAYKMPQDMSWNKGALPIWQCERLSYVWDTVAPEQEALRQPNTGAMRPCSYVPLSGTFTQDEVPMRGEVAELLPT